VSDWGLEVQARLTQWIWPGQGARRRAKAERQRLAALHRPSWAAEALRLKRAATFFLWLFCGLQALIVASCVAPVPAHADTIPRDAQRHQLTLKREAQQAWGLGAPVATFAAQVHQESRWREAAKSPVGAQGLAQFMPATSHWIGGLYTSLGERAPTNPVWALRALVVYDKWLADRIHADNACERMAFTLSAYNGGLGWVYKRQRRSPQPGLCFDASCVINPGITPASQAENQHYPAVILRQFEPLYAAWGPGSCGQDAGRPS
jgi:soluble lytic murein transglycosylase-like protein